MELVAIDPLNPDPAVIARAAALLKAGRLVAFPTETVYGLGANALDASAVERIYEAKGRPAYNPVIVHVATAARALDVVQEWPELAERLARAFWPGPLTMVLPRRASVPDIVSAGLGSVAVRVPAHPVALALLAACGLPVAAPSANRSMLISPTTGAHVAKSLGDAVDLILDAGPTTVGIESTVIDLTSDRPTMLRPGMIAVPDIEAIIGPIDVATHATAASSRPSPGMMDRHYSPRGRLVIVGAGELPDLVRREREAGSRIGAMLIETTVRNITVVRMPADAAGYAAELYRALHNLDDAACSVILVERVPSSIEWFGVRDRLERASRSA